MASLSVQIWSQEVIEVRPNFNDPPAIRDFREPVNSVTI